MDEEVERRLERTESHLAHQETTIAELSDVLAEQWRLIENLGLQVARLRVEMQALQDHQDSAQGPEPPPPHY